MQEIRSKIIQVIVRQFMNWLNIHTGFYTVLTLALLTGSCHSKRGDTYSVMSGEFKFSLTESGELQAISAAHITTPRVGYQYSSDYKIIGLVENGKVVKKGDTIIRIDPASIYKYIIGRENDLENQKAASKKLVVELENSKQELQAQLLTEEAVFNLKKLELDKIKFESETKRKIKELEFKQASLSLENTKRKIASKIMLDKYDLRIQKIRVQQYENEVRGAKETLKKMTICSPLDGILQLGENFNNGQNIRVGDRVWQGSLIASIPDISYMKAISYINEADISKIKIGMKVIVRLDALNAVPFIGTLTDVSKICKRQDNGKVFSTEIEIQGSDIRLKPGMTVSCEYVCYESENETYVPNSCLLNEKGRSYIFLKKGSKSERVEVEKISSNSFYSAIKTDVKPGQKLVPLNELNDQLN